MTGPPPHPPLKLFSSANLHGSATADVKGEKTTAVKKHNDEERNREGGGEGAIADRQTKEDN